MVAFMVHMVVFMVDMDLVLDMPVAMDMVLELLTIQVVTAMSNSQFKVSMDTTMARGLLNHMVLLVMVWELLDILVMPQALLAEPSMDTHHSIIMARGLLMLNHMVFVMVMVWDLLDIMVMPPAMLAEPSMDTHHFIMVRGPQMPNHMVLLVMFVVTVLE